MSNIIENIHQTDGIRVPAADIFLFGSGRVSFGWNFTRKLPFWLLYYNAGPGARLDFSGRTVRPAGKEIVLIPPGTPFRCACEKPFQHLYVHFTAGPPYSQVKPEVLLFDRSVCGPLDLLLDPETASPAAVYAFLFSVLASIPPKQMMPDGLQTDDRIRRSMHLMSQGMHRKEICREVGMSQSSFQRKFKAETGMTPHRYAFQLAMEKARAMLSFGNDGIAAIAEACGFADRYIFSKAFKKETGLPPAEYRSCSRRRKE